MKKENITRFEMNSLIEENGLVATLNDIADTVKDPIKSDLLRTFINETTVRLSEEDMEALTEIVLDGLTDFNVVIGV